MVLPGEGGLHAEAAAVDVEEDREFPGRVGYFGEEDPDRDGRVVGDDGVFCTDAGDGVVGRWDFFAVGSENDNFAILVDSEEGKFMGYVVVVS